MPNKIWIDTDYVNDADEIQAMIVALTHHLAGDAEIVGISCGYPRGDPKKLKKLFKAFERDGFKIGIPVYQGAKDKYPATRTPIETRIAIGSARWAGQSLFCAWGSLSTFAAVVTDGEWWPQPLHAICSWNRIQDEAAYECIDENYGGSEWIDNERDFRSIYLGWDLKRNRAWVKKIAEQLPKNVRKFWLDAAAEVTPSGTWKGGDLPSFHWAIHYDGGPMKYVTRRKKILDEFTEEVESLFGKEKV